QTRQSRFVSFTSASTFKPPSQLVVSAKVQGLRGSSSAFARQPSIRDFEVPHGRFRTSLYPHRCPQTSNPSSRSALSSPPGSEGRKKRSTIMKSAILTCAAAMLSLAPAANPACAAAAPKSTGVYDVASLGNPLGGSYGQGSSITNRGEVAGFDALPGNTVMHAVRWRNGYAPQDLGTLGGPNSAVAWPNRNDSGAMAGVAETSTTQPNGEYWSCALAV